MRHSVPVVNQDMLAIYLLGSLTAANTLMRENRRRGLKHNKGQERPEIRLEIHKIVDKEVRHKDNIGQHSAVAVY